MDLNTKTGRAKVAKFILSAANRDPDVAAKYFGGHALLVLGVGDRRVTGIAGLEMKDLERVVNDHLGPVRVGWDMVPVQVGDTDRDVVIISCDPPDPRLQPVACHKDGHNLFDGHIYIRRDGGTSHAKGIEIDAMRERHANASLTADIDVVIDGPAWIVDLGDAFFHRHIDQVKTKLLEPLRAPKSARRNALQPSTIAQLAEYMNVDSRTPAQFRSDVEAWADDAGDHWQEVVDHLARHLSLVTITINNRKDLYLEELDVEIHVEGACQP